MDDGDKQVSWLAASPSCIAFPDRWSLIQWHSMLGLPFTVAGAARVSPEFPFHPLAGNLSLSNTVMEFLAGVNAGRMDFSRSS